MAKHTHLQLAGVICEYLYTGRLHSMQMTA